jgi:hypothetical protein
MHVGAVEPVQISLENCGTLTVKQRERGDTNVTSPDWKVLNGTWI